MSILQRKDNDSQHWLTISDLMSGLMILFIFISIAFMRIAYLEKEAYTDMLEDLENIEISYKEILREKDKIDENLKQIKGIAEAYQNNQLAIYQALSTAFPKELLDEKNLNAEIDANTLTFVFKSSDSLFDNASSNLKDNYKQSLAYFFPKYINAILPYKDSINEIRIEGHTSSEWSFYPNQIKNQNMEIKKLYGYFENMKLSQARTNSVLNYVLMDLKDSIPNEHRQWLRDHTAAVGLSSSKPILDMFGHENPNKSRRVTFRIITNADSKIQQILKQN